MDVSECRQRGVSGFRKLQIEQRQLFIPPPFPRTREGKETESAMLIRLEGLGEIKHIQFKIVHFLLQYQRNLEEDPIGAIGQHPQDRSVLYAFFNAASFSRTSLYFSRSSG